MPKKTIHFCLRLTILFSAILVLGWYIFNCNKGFNLSDEGFYLVSGAYPMDVKMQLTSFHHYLHGLMFLQNNVIFLRLATLTIYMFALSLLAFSLSRLLQEDNNEKHNLIELLLGSMTTVLGLVFIFPMVANYNAFTITGSIIFYSILVLLMTSKTNKFAEVFAFLLGFIAVFVLFNKFTTGILLIFLGFVSIGFMGFLDKKTIVKTLLFYMLGQATHLLIFFTLIQDPLQFFKMYQFGLHSTTIMQSNHSLALFSQYWEQSKELLIFSFQKYQFALYVALVIFLVRRTNLFTNSNLLKNLLGLSLLALLFIATLENKAQWNMIYFMGLTSFYFSIIGILLLISLPYLNKIPVKHLFLLTILFLLPFIIAIGTNNPLHLQILLSIFVWIPIIVYLANLSSKPFGSLFMYATVAGVSVLSAYFALYNLSHLPYGLYGNLADQRYLTRVNKTNLYLDAASKYIIDNTRERLKDCGFKPQDYVLSLTDVPGLTYALGARSPSCPWYFGSYPGSAKLAEYCLSLSLKTEILFVLLDSYPGQQPGFQENQLNNYFKNFSKKYALCGEITNIETSGGVCCKVPIHTIKIFKLPSGVQ